MMNDYCQFVEINKEFMVVAVCEVLLNLIYNSILLFVYYQNRRMSDLQEYLQHVSPFSRKRVHHINSTVLYSNRSFDTKMSLLKNNPINQPLSSPIIRNKISNKQNTYISNSPQQFTDLKVQSLIHRIPEFSPPETNFEVSAKLRQKIKQIKDDLVMKLPTIKSSQFNESKIDASLSYRTQVKELQQWLREKLKNPPTTHEDSIEYKNMIMGIGMKQVIRLVRTRCNEQAEMIDDVWELTWAICREIILYLSRRSRKCEKVLEDELVFYRENYDKRLLGLETKKEELETANRVLMGQVTKGTESVAKLKKKCRELQIQLLSTEQMNMELKREMRNLVSSSTLIVKGDFSMSEQPFMNQLDVDGSPVSMESPGIVTPKTSQIIPGMSATSSQQNICLIQQANRIRQQEFKNKTQIQMKLQQLNHKISINTQTQQTQFIENGINTHLQQYTETDMNTEFIQLCEIGTEIPEFPKNTQNDDKKNQNKQKGIKVKKNVKIKNTIHKTQKRGTKHRTDRPKIIEMDSKSQYDNDQSCQQQPQEPVQALEVAEQSEKQSVAILGRESQQLSEMFIGERQSVVGRRSDHRIISQQMVLLEEPLPKLEQFSGDKQSGTSGEGLERQQEAIGSNIIGVQGSFTDNPDQVVTNEHPATGNHHQMITNEHPATDSHHQMITNEHPATNNQHPMNKNQPFVTQIEQSAHEQTDNQYAQLLSQLQAKNNRILELQQSLRQLQHSQPTNPNQQRPLRDQIANIPSGHQPSMHSKLAKKDRIKSWRDLSKIKPNSIIRQKSLQESHKAVSYHLSKQANRSYRFVQPPHLHSSYPLDYQQSCQNYLNQRVQSINPSHLSKHKQTYNNQLAKQQYKQAMKQVENVQVTPNEKQSMSTIEKVIMPVFKDLIKELQSSVKNDKVRELRGSYLSLALVVVNKFNRMYGVRGVATKHFKDLLIALKNVEKVSHKYSVIHSLVNLTDSQKGSTKLLFVYVNICYMFDPQNSSSHSLTDQQLDIIIQLCSQHLTDNHNFIIRLEQTKSQLRNNQHNLNSFYLTIIRYYHQFCQQRCKQMNFIFQLLCCNQTVKYGSFVSFISGIKCKPEWNAEVLRTMVDKMIEAKLEREISLDVFNRFVVAFPGFSCDRIGEGFDGYQNKGYINLSCEQVRKKLVSVQKVNSFIGDVVDFVFQSQTLTPHQVNFLVYYIRSYHIESQVANCLGLLGHGVLDPRISRLQLFNNTKSVY